MRKKRRLYNHELPPIGTKIVCRFKEKEYDALIVASSDSSLGKAIEFDGKLYFSLSSAARAITGFPTNGWRYWKWQ